MTPDRAFVRGVALFAIAAAAQVCAGATQSVTFDDALTNSTEWTFSGGVKRSAKGRYYMGAKDPLVTSPDFGFAITSVVFSVELSSSCNRNFIVAPADDAARPTSLAREFKPVPGDTRIVAEWRGADMVAGFTVSSTSGSYSLYFDTAEISGIPFPSAPAALRAACGGTTAVIKWRNPPTAASNIVEVTKIVSLPEEGDAVVRYGFDQFSAGGTPVAITNELPVECAGLSGSFVYAPANSQGMIQLSSGDNRGVLVHEGFPSYAGMKMRLVARRYAAGDRAQMGVAYVVGAQTNEFATIDNDVEFATNVVDLASVPGGAKIVLNSSGAKTNHRVILDELEFRVFSHEEPFPVMVARGVSHVEVAGLEVGASYRVRVSALDAHGVSSASSPPLEFVASAAMPMRITVQ